MMVEKLLFLFYLLCILFTSTAARPGCRCVPPCCQRDAAFQNFFPFLSAGTRFHVLYSYIQH